MAEKKTVKTEKKENWKPTKKELKSILDADVYDHLNHHVFNFEGKFLEPCLGTVPKDPEIYAAWVASKAEKNAAMTEEKLKGIIEEESATVDTTGGGDELTAQEAEGWTGFHKDEEGIFSYNYMLIGNLKANIKALNDNGSIPVIRAFKKACDLSIYTYPRRIHFYRDSLLLTEPDGYEEDEKGIFHLKEALYSLERSLRASGPQGERTTITRSDMLSAGTKFKFTVKLLRNKYGLTPEILFKALKMCELHGLGQWRGSGDYGKFKITYLD